MIVTTAAAGSGAAAGDVPVLVTEDLPRCAVAAAVPGPGPLSPDAGPGARGCGRRNPAYVIYTSGSTGAAEGRGGHARGAGELWRRCRRGSARVRGAGCCSSRRRGSTRSVWELVMAPGGRGAAGACRGQGRTRPGSWARWRRGTGCSSPAGAAGGAGGDRGRTQLGSVMLAGAAGRRCGRRWRRGWAAGAAAGQSRTGRPRRRWCATMERRGRWRPGRCRHRAAGGEYAGVRAGPVAVPGAGGGDGGAVRGGGGAGAGVRGAGGADRRSGSWRARSGRRGADVPDRGPGPVDGRAGCWSSRGGLMSR